MPRKIIYLIFFLVILGAIIGLDIYSQKINSSGQAPGSSIQSENSSRGDQDIGNTSISSREGPKDNASKTSADPSPRVTETPAKSNLTAQPLPAEKKSASRVENESSGAAVRGATGTSSAEKQTDGCAVEIAIVGMNGELLDGPKNVIISKKNKWGVTALGALDATGLPYTISARWGNFVEAIAGQRNKGQAGWMYKVNEEIPLVAADQKEVKTGDKIIWWYSKSMHAPPPNWDELGKKIND